MVGGMTRSSRLTGLCAFCDYVIAVRAYTVKGGGVSSDGVVARTLEGGGCRFCPPCHRPLPDVSRRSAVRAARRQSCAFSVAVRSVRAAPLSPLCVVCAVPQAYPELQVDSPRPEVMRVRWTELAERDRGGVIVSYLLVYWDISKPGALSTVHITNLSQRAVNVTDSTLTASHTGFRLLQPPDTARQVSPCYRFFTVCFRDIGT